MKFVMSAIFGAALLLGVACRNGSSLTRSLEAQIGQRISGRVMRELEVQGVLAPGTVLQSIIGRFTKPRCQPVCVAILKTFVSPSNCPAICTDIEDNEAKKYCMKKCRETVFELKDELKGSTGRTCSRVICPVLDGIVNGDSGPVVPVLRGGDGGISVAVEEGLA